MLNSNFRVLSVSSPILIFSQSSSDANLVSFNRY